MEDKKEQGTEPVKEEGKPGMEESPKPAEPEKEAEKKAEAPSEPKDEDSAKKVAELTDRLQRSMAEFENFRKRTEKEKESMYEMGVRSVIEKILPTIDNFERGLSSVPEENRDDSFVDGMEKVYRQLMKELDDLGVEPIESVGKPFDHTKHNAVMHVEDDSVGENLVVEEFQKGYTYRDSVVRYSMVKVAN